MSIELKKIYEKFAPFHFSPHQGWMNDPNALAYYNGKYHFFYQSNPYHFKWDAMHWGYATSKDGYKWDHHPIVMVPDPIYSEPDYLGGQFSGSALEVDGKLLIAFTHHHEKLGKPCVETQYITELLQDGSLKEPQLIVADYPQGFKSDNRDPKLFEYAGDIYFITGGLSEKNEGAVHLYKKEGKNWQYVSCIFKDGQQTHQPIECPDLYQLGGKWILSLSYMADYINPYSGLPNAVMAYIGTFNGKKFEAEHRQILDYGPDCYAPQTFIDADGERTFVPWAANPQESFDAQKYPSVLGRFRKLSLSHNHIVMKPWAWPQDKIKQANELIGVTKLPAFISYHFKGIKELDFKIGDAFSITYKKGVMEIYQEMPHRLTKAQGVFKEFEYEKENYLEISFDGHMCEIIWNKGEGWATYRSHISYENLEISLRYDAAEFNIFTTI